MKPYDTKSALKCNLFFCDNYPFFKIIKYFSGNLLSYETIFPKSLYGTDRLTN